MKSYQLNHLDELEAEAIYILREVAGQFERPALLFSGGKDSITLVRLAEKAFRPGRFPFPLVHVDTGHNFPEVLEYRDELAARLGERLIVRKVEDTIRERQLVDPGGKYPSRNALQTYTLLDTIEEFGFDALIGGARRDEEKARAKERIFSHRDEFGQWNPRHQRPELWNIYNGKIQKGENIELPSIYSTHRRACVELASGQLLAVTPFIKIDASDKIVEA
ncbi:MAG: sulfate adenylyltransferase subunit CysD, partial [Saprospiraceae bacterium]|nr:sulfate adenylyltransferase subunit CysD [Saprospiraceae bacterium]